MGLTYTYSWNLQRKSLRPKGIFNNTMEINYILSAVHLRLSFWTSNRNTTVIISVHLIPMIKAK